MSVTNLRKTVAPARTGCRGTAEVTLGSDPAVGIAGDPADIVLIMDRSCSMNLQRMFHARIGARALIRAIAAATAPAGSSVLGSGTRMGMVSFSSVASRDVPLTNLLRPLTAAVSVLSASGEASHCAAFAAAEQMLKAAPGTSRKIAVMFTGCLSSAGGNAVEITDRMKAEGMEIYCIGLTDDPAVLESWASCPAESHAFSTAREEGLKALFHRVAVRIVPPGGIGAVSRSLPCEGRCLTSPGPAAAVACGDESVCPEPCPVLTEFTVSGCQDVLQIPLNAVCLPSPGRIVQLNLTLRSVCPGRRVAVSLILYEISPGGEKLPRGVRHLLIPAQEGNGCRDVNLSCIPFSLPEALNPATAGDSICSPRHFQAQVIANYVDTDILICQEEALVPRSCTGCEDGSYAGCSTARL